MCEGTLFFSQKKPVIPARVRERDTFLVEQKIFGADSFSIVVVVLFENEDSNVCSSFCSQNSSSSCSQQQKYKFFIVRLVRPSLSTNGADLMKVGARNSGSGTTRLTGWESSWRHCSSTQIRPEMSKEGKSYQSISMYSMSFKIVFSRSKLL